MSDSKKRNYIVWTFLVTYSFPRAELPESIDDWWAECGPDFPEWAECESERLVCESVSLQDIEIHDGEHLGERCMCDIEYVIHLSFDLDVPYEDATEEMGEVLTLTPPEGWETDIVETQSVEHYTR